MDDLLYDDVKALLERGFGDDRILSQILRACENNEPVSNFERNYVKSMIDEHQRKRPPEPAQVIARTKEATPAVLRTLVTPAQSRARPKRITKKRLLLAGIILVAVIGGAYFNAPGGTSGTTTEPFSIRTDLAAYNSNDLISISGVSGTSSVVEISIMNQAGVEVWGERVVAKGNGMYSTLLIAGGQGWEASGTYLITSDNGVRTKTASFSFAA